MGNRRDSPVWGLLKRRRKQGTIYAVPGADRIEGVHQIVHDTTQGSPRFSQELGVVTPSWSPHKLFKQDRRENAHPNEGTSKIKASPGGRSAG